MGNLSLIANKVMRNATVLLEQNYRRQSKATIAMKIAKHAPIPTSTHYPPSYPLSATASPGHMKY
jgi:hypothetical protein